MHDRLVVEWAPFRTAPGVSEDRLLAASQALQENFLAGLPGFVRRELLRGKDGQWADLVYWTDAAAAEGAIQAAAKNPACHAYFHLMDGPEAAGPDGGVLHFARVAAYGRGVE